MVPGYVFCHSGSDITKSKWLMIMHQSDVWQIIKYLNLGSFKVYPGFIECGQSESFFTLIIVKADNNVSWIGPWRWSLFCLPQTYIPIECLCHGSASVTTTTAYFFMVIDWVQADQSSWIFLHWYTVCDPCLCPATYVLF